MKKQIKRTISVLLSIIIVASLFAIVPIEAGAAGNSFSGATQYYVGNQVSGSITTSNKSDYYKFNMNNSGTIKLKFIAYYSWSSLYIYDSNLELAWSSAGMSDSHSINSTTGIFTETFNVPVVSGTYYLVISSQVNNYGNYYFNISVSSANESFKESVNTLYNDFPKARQINTNTQYYGQIAINDKSDFYKFTLGKSGKVDLKFNAYFEWTKLYIYNSKIDIVWSSAGMFDHHPVNTTTGVFSETFSVSLGAGTYYFVIGSLEPYRGNYNFKLSTSSSTTPSTQNTKPAAPTVSVANGVSGLDVAWGKVANATSYYVYYKTASSSWSSVLTSGTRVTLPSVKSGKYYYIQVQSIGANGVKGNYSKVKTMTYLSRVNITSLLYNGNNTLKWNAVPGANKYQIARLKSGDKAYTYFYTTSPSLTEKNAIGGIAYTYQVRAMYQTSNSGTAYGAWSATKSVPTLVAPTVTLSNKSNGIRVSWNSIRGAVRYIVYYKKSTDKNWSSAVTTNLYYPILNAQRGALYYVQVRPVGSTVSQPYSSVKSIVFK